VKKKGESIPAWGAFFEDRGFKKKKKQTMEGKYWSRATPDVGWGRKKALSVAVFYPSPILPQEKETYGSSGKTLCFLMKSVGGRTLKLAAIRERDLLKSRETNQEREILNLISGKGKKNLYLAPVRLTRRKKKGILSPGRRNTSLRGKKGGPFSLPQITEKRRGFNPSTKKEFSSRLVDRKKRG